MTSRPKARRRWLRWLVALALLFAGGPVALAALSRTRLAREYAGREAAEALRRELGVVAHIDEVDLDTEKLSIVARNIGLEHPKHGRFALVTTLRIRPSWWALLRGQVDLHAITIERATVWLKVRNGQIENLPALPETSRKPTDTLELPFNWLHIEQARLVVDAAPIAQGELRNIEIHLNASNPRAIAVQFYAAGGSVRHERGRDRLAHMDLTAVLAPKSLAITRLRVTTPEAQLDVRDAELALPLGERYRGHVQLELYVPQLLRWPHGLELPRLEGTVELGATVQGEGKQATGSAHLVVRRGLVKQFGLGERVELDARFDPTQVSFQGSAHLIRQGGRVDLRGALALRDGLPLSLHADVHDVSFAKLMEQLGVSPKTRSSTGRCRAASTCRARPARSRCRARCACRPVTSRCCATPGTRRRPSGASSASRAPGWSGPPRCAPTASTCRTSTSSCPPRA